jgi:tetratricopeptide (TPR) repeat protein
VTAAGDWRDDIVQGNSEFYARNYVGAEKYYTKVRNENKGNEPALVPALVNLSFLYSEYMFKFDDSLKISQEIMTIYADSESRSNLVEDLIQVGKYEEARKYAEEVLDTDEDADNTFKKRNSYFLNILTPDRSGYQILNRFFILCSYVLEGNNQKGEEALNAFISYYQSLGKDFRIREEQWIFKGLVEAIDRSNASYIAKFFLDSLTDLLTGTRNAVRPR